MSAIRSHQTGKKMQQVDDFGIGMGETGGVVPLSAQAMKVTFIRCH